METEFILYVQNQNVSREFYQHVLNQIPVTDVPGMTEFELSPGVKLGLMPLTGISRILGKPIQTFDTMQHRAELYLLCDDFLEKIQRAKDAGGRVISPAIPRDWGHTVAYFSDPDGYILALAGK